MSNGKGFFAILQEIGRGIRNEEEKSWQNEEEIASMGKIYHFRISVQIIHIISNKILITSVDIEYLMA